LVAWDIGNTSMTKTVERRISRTIRVKREELVKLREEVEDLIDSLDLLEARARSAGKPTISHEEMLRKYGLK